MGIKKYKDWAAWWDGLRTAAIKAGATSIVTNLGVFMSTNAVSSMNIPGLSGTGENWRTLLIGLVAQFLLHTVYASAVYIQANPDAAVVTETTNTEMIYKDGSQTSRSSLTTTTIPINEKDTPSKS